VIAAAVAILIFALGHGHSGGIAVQGNAVAMIEPSSNRVIDQISVGARPQGIAFGAGSLWVANLDDQTVSRIDPDTRQLLRSLSLPGSPTGIAASDSAVWVVGANAGAAAVSVRRLDPQFGTVSANVSIGNVVAGGAGSVAVSGGDVWVAPSAGLLTKLDAHTARIARFIDPNSGSNDIAIGAGAIWVTDTDANTVTRVDPTGVVTAIPVGHGPTSIAASDNGVWVSEALDNAVARIDPATRAVLTTIPVGQEPTGVALGAGSVWVANSRDGTVTRIDPASGKVTQTIDVGGSPQRIVVAAGHVWVTVDRPALTETDLAGAGGTAHLTSQQPVDYLDPALSFAALGWQIENATCVKLLNYPDRPAPAGGQLAPEAARSLPVVSNGGRIYTFTIRSGFRFSPPSTERVTAQTFRFAIERSLSPTMKGPAGNFLRDVVGATAYISGHARHISGIAARGATLTIRLTKPAPDLVSRIALPFFCAVPLDTPLDPKGVGVVPAAGPYYVSSFTPGQAVVLRRNPNYAGSRPHHLDRLVIALGVNKKTAEAEVVSGRSDFAVDGIDASDVARITARYGPGSPPAKKQREQFFVSTTPGVDYLILNSHRPLFATARLRRAASYAIDRRALARAGSPYTQLHDRPTDQYLPPGMPGYRDAHVYPLTPDISAARRLAGNARRQAVVYTCNAPPCDELAQIVKTDLSEIGIDVTIRAFPLTALLARNTTPGEPFDIAVSGGWVADYLDPRDFLNYALEAPGVNGPGFHDPAYSPKLAAASLLAGPRRYLTYGRLAVELERNVSPWAAYGNPTIDNFFSARMGCQVVQPVTGVDLAALCIRR
jgi:YVTN family beta-propeller protein